MKMSKHAQFDRTDRLVYIATTVGFGEVIIRHEREDSVECITDTGVVMIKSLKEDFLITAYICDIDKAMAICRAMGMPQVPNALYRKILKNRNHLAHQNKIIY
jgi:hypothetical protein